MMTSKQKTIVRPIERPYVIAIPSYKRSELITKKTLYTLFKNKINPGLVSVFVANEYEYDKYKNKFTEFVTTNRLDTKFKFTKKKSKTPKSNYHDFS